VPSTSTRLCALSLPISIAVSDPFVWGSLSLSSPSLRWLKSLPRLHTLARESRQRECNNKQAGRRPCLLLAPLSSAPRLRRPNSARRRCLEHDSKFTARLERNPAPKFAVSCNPPVSSLIVGRDGPVGNLVYGSSLPRFGHGRKQLSRPQHSLTFIVLSQSIPRTYGYNVYTTQRPTLAARRPAV
jgi:hypothetical protein